jgi:hypothetical protein
MAQATTQRPMPKRMNWGDKIRKIREGHGLSERHLVNQQQQLLETSKSG